MPQQCCIRGEGSTDGRPSLITAPQYNPHLKESGNSGTAVSAVIYDQNHRAMTFQIPSPIPARFPDADCTATVIPPASAACYTNGGPFPQKQPSLLAGHWHHADR